jgi:serine/threonine-protein kinase
MLGVLALVAAIAAGVLVVQARDATTMAEVADYRGATVEEVAADLRQNGWEVEQVDEFADGTEAGEILAQSPLPGTELADGGTITLTVSLGPPPVPVPTDLAGATMADATARLAELGLGIETASTAFDENVPAGDVIGLAEGVPAEIPKGDAVPVVVSDGPPPRDVPPLGGLTFDEAAGELGGLGLTAVRQDEYSETVAEGKVITSEPGEGESVPKGAEITVRMSLGPPLIPIPDVRGDSVSQAAAAIEAKGLCVSGTQGSPTRDVTGTVPSVGTEVKRGTCVTIVTN